MTLSDEQQTILNHIATVATQYQQDKDEASTTREQLKVLIKAAVNLKITTYQIAEVAQLSQPRISQIARANDVETEAIPDPELQAQQHLAVDHLP